MLNVWKLCDQIREVAYSVHVFLGPAHFERVYENALVHRLRKAGLGVMQQYPIQVVDEDGTVIGEYLADLFIDNILIVELKAARMLSNEHESQLLGYLRASGVEHGLLINFGSLKFQIRKFVSTKVRETPLGESLSSDP